MRYLRIFVKILGERGTRQGAAWLWLRTAKLLGIAYNVKPNVVRTPMEVVYVVADKDIQTLALSIASLEYLTDVAIARIVLVGPARSRVAQFAVSGGYEFVDELDLLGFGPTRYRYPEPSTERSGWLYQQLLKLAWAKRCSTGAYLVVDADTLFVGPVEFVAKGKYQFYLVEEWHQAYSAAVKQLLGMPDPSWLSFVAHMMVFDAAIVMELLENLELRHGVAWHEAIASTRKLDNWSCFSEYQLYAAWARYKYPERCKIRPLYNRSMGRSILGDEKRFRKFSKRLQTVSLHSYVPDGRP